jgi:hypothetical protein
MEQLCTELAALFAEAAARAAIGAQPDSRALGAYVERAITDSWEDICAAAGVKALPIPGRRTIYDCAFEDASTTFGVDISAKSNDETRYSDGGICSVDNLVRFLREGGREFLIAQFSYRQTDGGLALGRCTVVPFRCLPEAALRIENLGTGQFRLNGALEKHVASVTWNRPMRDFLVTIADMAVSHYARVAAKASERAEAMANFRDKAGDR